MEFANSVFDFLSAITVLDIIKAAIILALFVYTIFAFIVTRQVDLKQKTVETALGGFLELLSILHLGASLLLFLFAILVL